jgi:protoporphyrinogen IX oxidase
MTYSLLKALHVAAVLIWVGGILMQTVMIAAASASRIGASEQSLIAAFRRWDRRVSTPAMFAVWTFGTVAAVQGAWFGAGWLWAKLALVVALSGIHGMQVGLMRRIAAADREPPRVRGWMPVIVVAGIVAISFLVILKPF